MHSCNPQFQRTCLLANRFGLGTEGPGNFHLAIPQIGNATQRCERIGRHAFTHRVKLRADDRAGDGTGEGFRMSEYERTTINIEACIAEYERAIDERLMPALRKAIGDVLTDVGFLINNWDQPDDPWPNIWTEVAPTRAGGGRLGTPQRCEATLNSLDAR